MTRQFTALERQLVSTASHLWYVIDPSGRELSRTKRQRKKAQAIKREAKLIQGEVQKRHTEATPAPRLSQLVYALRNLIRDAVRAGLLHPEVEKRELQLQLPAKEESLPDSDLS